ncbi:hypothetical protein LCGC14_0701440 [marine sediment metagenome]|uniref:HD domain-containing protein n=1 Tax=marine sediment metagenome TaxID=412755 RepID=A0A0F9T3G3_9ZZZZ
MTEGTKSYLIGCHQFFLHPLWVLMAWRLEYKSWPAWWELICILFHDIGICGRQYLSDDKAKKGHWEKGARLSAMIIWKYFKVNPLRASKVWPWLFCAGHTGESGFSRSKLFRADKRSSLVAPSWWLWWNYWIEWSGNGISVTKPPLWKKLVAENLKRETPIDSHELYIRNRGKGN